MHCLEAATLGAGRFILSTALLSRLAGVALFTWLLAKLGVTPRQKAYRRIGDEIASTFMQLAGVYIKFGQILAMRPDLLPEEITEPLDSMFDRVPAEDLKFARETIQHELGDKASDILQKIQPQYIAAASFATVYRTQLPSDRWVAVKVQRHNIDRIVRRDLATLRRVARIIDLSGQLKRFRLSRFVAEFARWTAEELDYKREAQHMEYLRANQLANSIMAIPAIEWGYTSRRVLTMEYFEGVWLTDRSNLATIPAAARSDYAAEMFESFMHDIFELGFFHADPHPGNVCILSGGGIGLIDFGIVGFASEQMRRSQSELIWAIQRNDISAAFDAVQRVLEVPPDADLDGFQSCFENNVRSWHLLQYQPNASASERSGGSLLLANFQAAREFGLTFNYNAVRYYRAFILVDAIVTRLDAGFNQIDALSSYFQGRFLRQRASKLFSRLSSFDVEMVAAARLERMINGIERIVSTSADDVISSAINQTFLRISRIAHGLARALCVIGIIAIIAAIVARFWPFGWDARHLFAISLGLLFASLILSWTSRMTWIHAYKGQNF